MKTASQILEAKGYDNAEVNDIVNDLDQQVRDQFNVTEPVHLYESYYRGDADGTVLSEIALRHNLDGAEGLLHAMTNRLNGLAEAYTNKIDWYPAKQVEKIRLNDTVTIQKYSDLFDERLDQVSDEELEAAIRNFHEIEGFQ